MKFLIWFTCLVLASVVKVFIDNTIDITIIAQNLRIGALSAGLLAAFEIYPFLALARVWSRKWDKRKEAKKAAKDGLVKDIQSHSEEIEVSMDDAGSEPYEPVHTETILPRQSSNTQKRTAAHKQSRSSHPNAGLITSVVILCIILLASIGINIVQYLYHEQSISTNQLELTNQDNRIAELETQVSTKQETILALREEKIDLNAEIIALKLELSFYESHAVVVDEHTSYYHKHGCELLDMSYFWIYNTEKAEALGYDPCPYCN